MVSVNREHVIWQSSGGSWNIGFYAYTGLWEFEGADPDDFDHEWDVEYGYDEFWFLSTGHPDPDAAYGAYLAQHANPGGTAGVLHWSAETAERIGGLEVVAAAFAAGREVASAPATDWW
ncbi:hypothetical protein ACWEO1_01440 [Kitasatospora cineracea]